jgi:hypothetical protein
MSIKSKDLNSICWQSFADCATIEVGKTTYKLILPNITSEAALNKFLGNIDLEQFCSNINIFPPKPTKKWGQALYQAAPKNLLASFKK